MLPNLHGHNFRPKFSPKEIGEIYIKYMLPLHFPRPKWPATPYPQYITQMFLLFSPNIPTLTSTYLQSWSKKCQHKKYPKTAKKIKYLYIHKSCSWCSWHWWPRLTRVIRWAIGVCGLGELVGGVVGLIVNIQPTPVKWAVRKVGGLTYGDSLNSSGNDNNALFVCLLCRPENHWHQTKHL